jgi:hypothetical protein
VVSLKQLAHVPKGWLRWYQDGGECRLHFFDRGNIG